MIFTPDVNIPSCGLVTTTVTPPFDPGGTTGDGGNVIVPIAPADHAVTMPATTSAMLLICGGLSVVYPIEIAAGDPARLPSTPVFKLSLTVPTMRTDGTGLQPLR